MKKRKWIYIQHPTKYEIACDVCDGHDIEWSEYEHMIWCYDCKADTRGTGGIFSGPIPHGAMDMFGMSLDRIDLKTGKRSMPVLSKSSHKIYYREVKEKESESSI